MTQAGGRSGPRFVSRETVDVLVARGRLGAKGRVDAFPLMASTNRSNVELTQSVSRQRRACKSST